jgi:1,4-dihydroxy-6-naphthoate synthase
MKNRISLGFSPCPNDTFIFDAMVHHKIDTEDLEFDYHLADVEELNKAAFRQQFDVTKVSYHAFLFLTPHYLLLDSGGAMGFGTGPLIISKKRITLGELEGCRIAIPGEYTTANFLLSIAGPGNYEKVEMLFSEIEQAVMDETVEAGVIIHENRFTYESKGLKKILDLGECWENQTGLPVPLGGITVRQALTEDIVEKVERVLKRSVAYAMDNNEINEFIRFNAQEMSDEVIRKHIQLYVNDFSLALGINGRKAVETMFTKAAQIKIIPGMPDRLFATAP